MKKQLIFAVSFLILMASGELDAAENRAPLEITQFSPQQTWQEKLAAFSKFYMHGQACDYRVEFGTLDHCASTFIYNLRNQIYNSPNQPPEMSLDLVFLNILYYELDDHMYPGGDHPDMPYNIRQGIEQCLLSSKVPYAISNTLFAIMYRDAVGYERDPSTAITLLQNALEEGYPFTQRELADTVWPHSESNKLYKEVIKKGDIIAQYSFNQRNPHIKQ